MGHAAQAAERTTLSTAAVSCESVPLLWPSAAGFTPMPRSSERTPLALPKLSRATLVQPQAGRCDADARQRASASRQRGLGWILNHPNLQGPPRPGGPREAHY